MCNGFKQISNDFFESKYWKQFRTYSEGEAILDIANSVRFEQSVCKERRGRIEVSWGYAQWPASVRFLAARWKWTERHVRTFLSSLKNEGIISTDDSQGVNIITLHKFLVTRSDTVNDTVNDTDNSLNIRVVNNPSDTAFDTVNDTKNNNSNIYNNSSLRSELHTQDNARASYDAFLLWLKDNCPYIAKHYKMPTISEFSKLKSEYGSQSIANECENIENRVDLRKKYSNLYRTLLNWLKRSRKENGTKKDEHPTNSEMRQQSIELIEQLKRERHARIEQVRKRTAVQEPGEPFGAD